MPVWDFSDFADITDNARRITPRHNRNVSISVDRTNLYINENAFPNHAGATGQILQCGGTGMSWVDLPFGGETGIQGPTGAFGGPQGETGAQGGTGLGNFYQQSGFSGSTLVPALMWNFQDEAFYGYVTGVNGRWIQVSGGAQVGATGLRGITGLQGVTGAKGTLGFTGFSGATGIQGPTGGQGVTGSQGQTGSQGLKGDTGLQGLVGPTGAFGGPQGVTGLQGITGIQGIDGVTGPFGGPQGDTGLPGTSGTQGATGSQGQTGSQGSTGSQGVTGLRGVTGLQGVTGVGGSGTSNVEILGTTGSQNYPGGMNTTIGGLSFPIKNNKRYLVDGFLMWAGQGAHKIGVSGPSVTSISIGYQSDPNMYDMYVGYTGVYEKIRINSVGSYTNFKMNILSGSATGMLSFFLTPASGTVATSNLCQLTIKEI